MERHRALGCGAFERPVGAQHHADGPAWPGSSGTATRSPGAASAQSTGSARRSTASGPSRRQRASGCGREASSSSVARPVALATARSSVLRPLPRGPRTATADAAPRASAARRPPPRAARPPSARARRATAAPPRVFRHAVHADRPAVAAERGPERGRHEQGPLRRGRSPAADLTRLRSASRQRRSRRSGAAAGHHRASSAGVGRGVAPSGFSASQSEPKAASSSASPTHQQQAERVAPRPSAVAQRAQRQVPGAPPPSARAPQGPRGRRGGARRHEAEAGGPPRRPSTRGRGRAPTTAAARWRSKCSQPRARWDLSSSATPLPGGVKAPQGGAGPLTPASRSREVSRAGQVRRRRFRSRGRTTSLPRCRLRSWFDGVVPLAMEVVPAEVERGHLRVGDLDPGAVVFWSAAALTLSPVAVCVAAISPTTTSSVESSATNVRRSSALAPRRERLDGEVADHPVEVVPSHDPREQGETTPRSTSTS